MDHTVPTLGSLAGALIQKLTAWTVGFVQLLPNLALALLVLALAAYVSGLVGRFVRSTLDRTSRNIQLNHLGSSLAKLAVLALGLFVALSIVGLDQAVASLLAGVGVIGIVLGFAFQETGANFVSGILMAIRQPFRVGDIVQSNDFLGIVEDIDLRATTLRQFTGERVLLPNREVFGNAIENLSSYGRRRADLAVGVSYDSDLEEVRRVTLAAVQGLPGLLPEPPPEVLFTGFGESSIDLSVRMWSPYTSNGQWLRLKSDAIQAIHVAYREHGIAIPFPVRTLDLSGAAGSLREIAADARRA